MRLRNSQRWSEGIMLSLILLFSAALQAQNEQKPSNKLSLISINALPSEGNTSFELNFETDSLNIQGHAQTHMDGYDSLSLSSFEMIDSEDGKLLKIKGYMIDKESNHMLRWVSAVNYTSIPKNLLSLTSAKYIQFAAYYKLDQAVAGLKFFDGFDIDIVQVNGMYKLVAPYSKNDFKQAKTKYAEYHIWPVSYQEARVVETDF